MDITITGYDGENVIAQIIEDLLTINGLSVKREDFSPIHANLSIDQLDRQLNILKKNKVMFNIKVVKEEKPKYSPKTKLKPKLSFSDVVGRTVARMPDFGGDDLGNLFEDIAVAQVAVAPQRYVAGMPVAHEAFPRRQDIDMLVAQVDARMAEIRADDAADAIIGDQEIADEAPPIPAIQPIQVIDNAPRFRYAAPQWTGQIRGR